MFSTEAQKPSGFEVGGLGILSRVVFGAVGVGLLLWAASESRCQLCLERSHPLYENYRGLNVGVLGASGFIVRWVAWALDSTVQT